MPIQSVGAGPSNSSSGQFPISDRLLRAYPDTPMISEDIEQQPNRYRRALYVSRREEEKDLYRFCTKNSTLKRGGMSKKEDNDDKVNRR